MTAAAESKGSSLAETLPSGWCSTAGAEVFDFVTSGSRGWAKYYSDTGPLFLRVGNLDHYNIALDLRNKQHVTPPQGAEVSRTRVRPGDLLISITADVGMVGLVPDGIGEAYVNQHVAIARPREGIDPAWLAWIFTSPGVKSQLKALDRGATKMGLGLDDIRRVRLRLPPRPIQHVIVSEIEKHFTRLDAAVASLRRAWSRMKSYRAAVLRAAVRGELVAPSSQLTTGPASGNQTLLVPSGWRSALLGEVAEIQGGIQKQPKRAPKDHSYSFLRVANVLRGRLDLSEVHRIELFGNEIERLRLQRGDLLIVEGNGSQSEIGRMAIWTGEIADCVHQNHIIRARLRPGLVPEFVAIYWNSPDGAARVADVASSTSGLYTLSVRKIAALPVPIPPLEEQEQIVKEVARRMSLIDRSSESAIDTLTRSAALRRTILAEAFAGRLVKHESVPLG